MRQNDENLVELLDPTEGVGRKTVEQVRALSAEIGTELSVEGAEVVVGEVSSHTK